MVTIGALPLKIVFFGHLVLTTWAIQGFWLPSSYLYYNAFFLFTLLWSIHHKESEEPVFMALVIDITSFILDIISMSVFYPFMPSSHQQFSLCAAIINLVGRILSVLILYRIMSERNGNYNDFGIPNLGNYFGVGGNANRGPYEDIDHTIPQSVPQNNLDPCNPQYGGKEPYVTGPTLGN